MRTDWTTPLDLPTGRAGQFMLVHHRVADTETTMLDTGESVTVAGPHRWHCLLGPGVTASDLPRVQASLDRSLRPITWGRTVLVGGLGLGYAATVLARRRKIKRVIVVERQKEVIDLVWPYLLLTEPDARAKVEVVHTDVFAYLTERRARQWQFDWAFFNLWKEPTLDAFFNTVLPLYAHAAAIIPDNRIFCADEDRMRAMLLDALRSPASRATEWAAPFWRWAEGASPEAREQMMRAYCRTVGLPQHAALWQSAIGTEAAL